ncbi:MAG: glycosyltransferase [Candidatus Aenigmarchaeota archaeon]|nr:glycosyltransferase [Candidatus Aenigmarchaeota archaeon]MCK5234582.1 glycosyltransferase [Candidatus Aenigmarchaeota archaeon]
MDDKKPELSIIIPTLNEGQYLSKLLKSIKIQTYKDYEIIVSDSNSDDKTVDVAKSFGARVFIDDRKGPGHGRNCGAKIARGKYLLFLDADVILPIKTFLEDFLTEIKTKKLQLANCFHFLYPFDVKDIPADILLNLYFKARSYISPVVPGFFIFIKKDLFDDLSGFDETIAVCEDTEFVRRAYEHADFKMLNQYIYFSNRRLNHEGRLKLFFVYTYLTFQDVLPAFLSKLEVDYKFGHYDKVDEHKEYDILMAKINSFFENHRKLVKYAYDKNTNYAIKIKDEITLYLNNVMGYAKKYDKKHDKK